MITLSALIAVMCLATVFCFLAITPTEIDDQ